MNPHLLYNQRTLPLRLRDHELWVRDDDQGFRAAEHAGERPLERLGVERGEALIEDAGIERLQKRTRDVEPPSFPVRQLPAALADQLLHPRWHAREQGPEVELAADRLGFEGVLA